MVVRGERIERVGPRSAVEVPPAAQVIDGRGRTLMPGLIDAHVHLARTEDLAILLALGVTTVRNMWGAPIHLEWRDRVARGELPGPTIYTAGPIVDGEHPAHPGSLIVRSEADADRAIALHRQLGYDLVKVYSRLTPPVFDLDGATGRGHLDVARDVVVLHARGTSLPGVPAALDRAIAADGLLAPDTVLSRIALWRPRLVPLAVGQAIEVVEHTVGLASEIDDSEQSFQVRRGEDRAGGSRGAARVYEITPPRGPRSELVTDADGWPMELAVRDHGALLRLRRRP